MRKMIGRAIRKIKRNKIPAPPDGMMINVIDSYSRRGKWQVEYIHDTRFFAKPYVAAFYFKGHAMHCRQADYCLSQTLS